MVRRLACLALSPENEPSCTCPAMNLAILRDVQVSLVFATACTLSPFVPLCYITPLAELSDMSLTTINGGLPIQ